MSEIKILFQGTAGHCIVVWRIKQRDSCCQLLSMVS